LKRKQDPKSSRRPATETFGAPYHRFESDFRDREEALSPSKKALDVGHHLVADPKVCHGKLTFKGTRLPVQTVLTLLSRKGRSINYVLKSWPHLKREAIEEAVRLAITAWPELLDAKVAENMHKLAESLSGDTRGRGAKSAISRIDWPGC